ncbi:MAG: N-6 DNA methylase, partial [Thermoguttaceae bacterium]|nr:N-6 DNA methylase [Thermoguttaceae bacterium]
MKKTADSLQSQDVKREKKSFGRVYTPKTIVDLILDLADYRGSKIVGKHVVDNSCGDGSFLTEIVERYCRACSDNLKTNLETFVHGIEIDEEERQKCLARLDAIAARYGVSDVRWDVVQADATRFDRFDAQMDYVFGNPPYVRVHNLGASFDRVKTFEFARGGMTDLYLVFYEIGLKTLRHGGVLGYITPSSFFNSIAGAPLRNCLVRDNLLDKLVDLGHYQVFNATTYATIVVLKKNRKQESTEVFEYDGLLKPIDFLRRDEFFFNDRFFMSSRENLKTLKEIFALGQSGTTFQVKNGFATLADSFFIGESLDFENTIPVVKASTGKWTRCLFPYADGRLIPYGELTRSPKLAAYYAKNVDRLKKRSLAIP